jgi:peptidyl-tRNA hydrolase, PTH1 family
MKIVVGLGNPGRRYAGTRHNLGYDVVDQLAQSDRCGTFRDRFDSLVADSVEDDQAVMLVKPQSFMNLSGLSVRRFVDFYQLPLSDLLVVCDDINLPLGKLRIRRGGTHGGHNGLRNIELHLGTNEYPRLRIGVEAPATGRAIEHVLGRFQPGERAVVDEAVAKAVQAVVTWVQKGIDVCMNEYNG